MRCPFCDADNDKVIDSRSADGSKVVRRRRECVACGRRFTTYERIEEAVKLMVIKKDGTRVPYDKQKILSGIQKACYKRPVPAERIQRLLDSVEEYLFHHYEREVESQAIGEAVSHRLKALDQIAYVRFASVYKNFRDVEDFLEEVREAKQAARQSGGPEQPELF